MDWGPKYAWQPKGPGGQKGRGAKRVECQKSPKANRSNLQVKDGKIGETLEAVEADQKLGKHWRQWKQTKKRVILVTRVAPLADSNQIYVKSFHKRPLQERETIYEMNFRDLDNFSQSFFFLLVHH